MRRDAGLLALIAMVAAAAQAQGGERVRLDDTGRPHLRHLIHLKSRPIKPPD
jgi:hypothetical protein